MKRRLHPIRPTSVIAVIALALAVGALFPRVALADVTSDLYGTTIDKADFYDDGTSAAVGTSSSDDVQLTTQSAWILPRSLSGRMLYYAKWESGQNYDQGLSYGDGYHAMGFFQFDNRYGLGEFLDQCYQYDPDHYSMFAQFEGVDLSSATLYDNGLTDLGNRLNAAWHAAYAAHPAEFSELQNDYAYETYYVSASDYMSTIGIDLDAQPDYVQGLCWGMCNLFGSYGWRSFVTASGVSAGYDGQTIAYLLTTSVIDNVSSKYPSQSEYWDGWIGRYEDERDTCLGYGYDDADAYAASVADISLPAGTYAFESAGNPSAVLDVAGGSAANGANVQVWSANSTDAQKWYVTSGGDGYCTITNAASGAVLDASGGVACAGTNVQQWSGNSSRAQHWVASRNSDGTYTFHSALGKDLVCDLEGGSTADGTNVRLYSSNGTSAQRFACVNQLTLWAQANKTGSVLASGAYVVTSGVGASKVLDVAGGSTDAGANVQIWGANGTAAQVWYVTVDSDGFVTLTNAGSGKALDVAGALASSGTNVGQWDLNSTNAQRWVATKNPDGTVTLWSALGNEQVLDVTGGSADDGTNVETWSANGSAAQRFNFASTTSSLDVSEGCYVLGSLAGGQVLDVASGSLDEGGNVQTWSGNGTLAQRWYVRASSVGYTIQNVRSGLYLTASDGNVVQTAYVGSASQWSFVTETGSPSSTAIMNEGTGLALDVAGGSHASGANVQVWSSNFTSAQRWSLSTSELVGEGTFELACVGDATMRLDVAGGSTDDGANVQIWGTNGTDAQRWVVSSAGSGLFRIANARSGRVLDVAGGSADSGTNVWQWTSNGTNAQLWLFVMGTRGVIVRSALGSVLDVAGGYMVDGTNVQSYSANGTSAQEWLPLAV